MSKASQRRFIAASMVASLFTASAALAVPTDRLWVGLDSRGGNWGFTPNWTPSGGFLTSQLDNAIFAGPGLATVNSFLGGGSRAGTDLRYNNDADGIINIDYSDAVNGTAPRSYRLVGGITVAPDAAGTLNLTGVGVHYWGIFTDANASYSHSITNNSTVGGVLNFNVTQTFGETLFTTDTTLNYGGTGAINLNGPVVTADPLLRTVNIVKTGSNTVRSTGANAYNGSTTVEGGTLAFTNDGTKNAWNSALTNATGLNIKGGQTVFEYSGTATTPADTINAALTASYANGFASGQIYSSTAVATQYGLGWADDTAAGKVTVAYTRYGDANLDLVVDFNDLVALAQNYSSETTGRTWSQGDFNYDGLTNFNDLVSLAQAYGQHALTSDQTAQIGASFAGDFALAQSLVPEPTTLMAAIGLGATAIRRRRD